MLYRGLPSEFWEPELRAQELIKTKTIKLHGYPFYEEPIPIQGADAEPIDDVALLQETFRRYDEKKRCSGYSAGLRRRVEEPARP